MLGTETSIVARKLFAKKIDWLKSADCDLPYWVKLLIYFAENILMYDWRYGRNWLSSRGWTVSS